MSEQTKDWELYENGKKYNNKLEPNYYDTVNANLDFYAGNQWRNVEANGMPTPVFNMIKRAISFFTAYIMSSRVKVNYEPLAYANDDAEPNDNVQAADIATAEVENLFDKFKFDNRLRDACTDAAVIGDAAAHIYFDPNALPYGGAFTDVKGEICFELVDGTNVMLGNANNPSTDVKVQPYIIVSGRDMVESLKAEAKQYQSPEEENIVSDRNYNDQAGEMGKVEIDSDEYGKALYIIVYKYDKKTQTIHVSKCTENVYIYKDIDTGLKYYPVAWLNWEKQKNQYHGRAVCTGLIPNQIFINRMFAMVMYHLMMVAFPKAVYNKDYISAWTNQIGEAIGIDNMQVGENIKNIAGYLEPGNMSNQITQVIDLAIQYTKETLGINDAMLGNINPEQASGRSIISVVQQSGIPLENPKSNIYEWVEDIGKILLDMMSTYYGQRPIVINQNGQKAIVEYDFSQLKNMWLNVKCDVGPSSYWSEIATVETLDNLLNRNDGIFTIVEYLESLPEDYIPNQQDLIDKLKAKIEAQQQPQPQNDYETMAQFMESLPPDVQQELKSMPDAQMEETVKQMMAQGGGVSV